jgi:eukaryotic-like serine/threonine-protein kinase
MHSLSAQQWSEIQLLFENITSANLSKRSELLANSKLDTRSLGLLKSMLAAEQATGILDHELSNNSSESLVPMQPIGEGTRIGGFVIDDIIDRGGMGEVYRAHRKSGNFYQRVAIKLLRPDAIGQATLFDRERRLLASLEHPGIARLIDGGMTKDKRPYIVMEYVDGQSVDDWCERQKPNLATRLRLFISICEAVSFAHSRLVIHRDIKPSNIMVDTTGRARLLDFGIAKLLDAGGVISNTTQAMVTPDYAAPEQLASEAATVTTDVYALGALLFEMLTGNSPWRTGKDSLPSIMRRILSEDPPVPSSAPSLSMSAIPAKSLKGDLDAVILKAMRRNPAERYQSAAELKADIARHLDLKPVRAREGSRRYMVGRFIRRNRIAVAASAAGILALLFGGAGIAWQARKTGIERDIAFAEVKRSAAVNNAMIVMFRDAKEKDGVENISVRKMLDDSASRIVGSVKPGEEAVTLVTTLSDLYVMIEDGKAVGTLLQQAHDRKLAGPDPIQNARINYRLAAAKNATGKPDEALALLDPALAAFNAQPGLYRKEEIEARSVRASIARSTGDLDLAISLLETNADSVEHVFDGDAREILTQYLNLVVFLSDSVQFEKMPHYLTLAGAVAKRMGVEQTEQSLRISQLWGIYHYRKGQFEQAERELNALLATRKANLGVDMGLASTLYHLARAEIPLGKPELALAHLDEALAIAQKSLGPVAPPTLNMELTRAEALAELGRAGEASTVLDKVKSVILANPKPVPMKSNYYRALAILQLKAGKKGEALIFADLAEAQAKSAGAAGKILLAGITNLRQRIANAKVR